MRRNYTAMAALSDTYHGPVSALDTRATPVADGGSPLRRNISASTLCELRRREQVATRSDASLQGSRAAVVEAVACKILEHILGDDVAHAAMRDHIAASAGAPADSGSGSSTPVGGSRTSSRQASRDTSCIDNEAAEAAAAVAAAQDAAKLEGVPPGISQSLQAYILTIVRHLELPNSCIVAALIYVQRAVSGTRFTLSVTNWQPCLLAAFVIAAKLSFDEPVWNEDFVKALRISNVQVRHGCDHRLCLSHTQPAPLSLCFTPPARSLAHASLHPLANVRWPMCTPPLSSRLSRFARSPDGRRTFFSC